MKAMQLFFTHCRVLLMMDSANDPFWGVGKAKNLFIRAIFGRLLRHVVTPPSASSANAICTATEGIPLFHSIQHHCEFACERERRSDWFRIDH